MAPVQHQAAPQRGMPAQQLFNRMVVWLLQSPFHRLLSKHLMVLVYTGRRTGVQRRVPLTYLQDGHTINVFCEQDVTWWKNVQEHTAVTVWLRGQPCAGQAVAVRDDPDRMRPIFAAFLRNNRQAGGFHDVPFESTGRPHPVALERALQTKVMVQITLLNG